MSTRAARVCPAGLVAAALAIVALPGSSGAAGFLENRGQIDETVSFYGSAGGATVYFTPNAVVLDLKDGSMEPDRRGVERFRPERACAVHVLFENAATPVLEPRAPLPGLTHFLLGDDPAAWRTGVRAFGEVVYREVWPGIDLVYRIRSGRLEYEAVVQPGADPGRILFRYEGADRVLEVEEGTFRIETIAGGLTDARPVPGRMSGTVARVGFGGSPEAEQPDTMQWCTYVGGTGDDSFDALVVDAQSRPIVSGTVDSIDYPTTAGAYDSTYNGDGDAVVTKLTADGDSLVWSTYLGGSGRDWGWNIALDALGRPVIGGDTRSADFPTTPGAFDSTLSGGAGPDYDNFVTKLTADGDSLVWSTYLGGGQEDYMFEVILDAAQNVVATGWTDSNNFPTTPGAYDETKIPFTAACYVTKLAADGGSLVWSTFLEGSGDDKGMDLALDDVENVVVVGQAAGGSTDFPTTSGAYDETHNGFSEMFVTKLAAAGSTLVWSTFVGGSDGDLAVCVALDPAGNPVVGGATASSDFPVTLGAYDQTYNGNVDAALLKLDSLGQNLLWATYYGGSESEPIFADAGHAHLVIDGTGSPILGSITTSPDLPFAWADVLGPFDATHNGGRDIFLVRFDPSGSSLTWSTYCGGSDHDGLLNNGLVLDHDGLSVLASAYVYSDDFPTSAGAYQETFGGGPGDGAVLKFTPPTAVAAPEIAAPTRLGLQAARPNPFRDATTIRYELTHASEVTLAIFDVTGRLVRVLERGPKKAGPHQARWDALDAAGSRSAAGVYWYRLQVGDREEARSVLLLR